MRRLDRDLVLDFLTLAVAVFSLSVFFSAFSTMFKSTEVFDRIFSRFFDYSIFSIGISYPVFQLIRYFLSFRFSMPDWTSRALWIATIISGTFLFSYFAFDSKFFGDFRYFFGWLLLALIPAAMFRLPVDIFIYSWQERKRTPLSIVK